MKPSTLRKLMSVYWEENTETNKNVGALKLLDEGKISINKAFDLLQEKKRKIKDKETRERQDFESKSVDVNYKLYNKSSMDLSDIPNNSVRLSIQSPPYFQLRDYRNQDELFHGQERSVAEYIKNEIRFYNGVREKLDDNGVLVIIVGDTYRGGYQGVCNKLETALEQDEWQILDVNQWVKTNPKSQPHENRFLPAYERIIVCAKKGAKPVFNDQKKPSSHGEFKVIRGTEKVDGTIGFSMSSPEASITNVITTSCFNRREFGGIDPGFTHDAPAPMEIYDKFILAYSNNNDVVLDMFSGSGQGLVSAIRNGRNAIGYDVDPVSIVFSKKRLDVELENRKQSVLRIAA
jgi:DNA modification methylase